jgi:hypothetical protein
MLIVFVVIFASGREEDREDNCCAYILVSRKHTIVMNHLLRLRTRNEQLRRHRTCWLLKCIKQWWRFTTRCEWEIWETTRFRVDHVMTNRKEMFFRSIRKSVLLLTQRERQRTYCGSVFELRTIVDNIYRYTKLYDIKRAESDDARGALSRHQILIFDLI